MSSHVEQPLNTSTGAVLALALALLLLAGAACLTTTEVGEPTDPSPTVETPTPPVAMAAVTGTITYRERIALSPDAVIEVVLADVSLADAPSVTIAQQTITNPGQVPVPFRIEYDPAVIDERRTYGLLVRIMEGNRLAFINDTAYDVITGGRPTSVDMVLVKVE